MCIRDSVERARDPTRAPGPPPSSPLERAVVHAAAEMLRAAPHAPTSAAHGAERELLLAADALAGERGAHDAAQRAATVRGRLGATLAGAAEIGARTAAGGTGEARLPAISTELREIERLLEAHQLDDMRALVAELSAGLFDELLVDTAAVVSELHRRGPLV